MRVDFAFGAQNRLSQAVSTTVKQVRRGAGIIVYCQDHERLNLFDKQLWALEGTDFIAHDILSESGITGLKVYLSQASQWPLAGTYLEQGYWLLNLDDQCPPLPNPASRVLEIVSRDENDKSLARQRWRNYKEAGCDLNAFELG